jgi:hypothetical protein
LSKDREWKVFCARSLSGFSGTLKHATKTEQSNKRTIHMKKTLLFLGTAITLTAPQLASANCTKGPAGFYVGAQAGYNRMNGKFTSNFTLPGLAPTASFNQTKHSNGFIGGLMVGYLWNLPSFCAVGLDLEANWDTNRLKLAGQLLSGNFVNSITRLWNVTPSIMLRVPVTQSFFAFAKLGLGVSSFRHVVNNQTAGRVFKLKQTRRAFVPTVGVEYLATQRLAMTGALTYEGYGRSSRNIPDVGPEAANDPYNSRVKVSYVSFKVGLKYYL